MNSFDDNIRLYEEKRQRAIEGKHNCLPMPFSRLRNILPGTEQGKYIIITANQKVGKSKLADFMYVYFPLFFSVEHPEFKFRVTYYTLEISPQEKRNEFVAHLLYVLDNIQISPKDLKSVDIKQPLNQKIIDLLKTERYQKYLDDFDKAVEFIDDTANPFGVFKKCRDYAEANGYPIKGIQEKFNPQLGKKVPTETVIRFAQNDPEEYRIVIIDNATNLTPEKGQSRAETIDQMSKYCIQLRNKYNYIVVMIQHQTQAQESLENLKYDKIAPSSDGLGDCKTTTRDINLILGLYNPGKFDKYKYNYENYNPSKLRNHFRILNVVEDRDYGSDGNKIALFFNGAVTDFIELPKPTEKDKLQKAYDMADLLDGIKPKQEATLKTNFMLFNKNSHKKLGKKKIKK